VRNRGGASLVVHDFYHTYVCASSDCCETFVKRTFVHPKTSRLWPATGVSYGSGRPVSNSLKELFTIEPIGLTTGTRGPPGLPIDPPKKNRSPTSPCPSPLSLSLIQPRRHPPWVQGRLTIHPHNNWPQALSPVRTGSCFRGRSNILKRSLAQLRTERGKLRPCVVHVYLTILTKIQMSFSATPNTFSL